VTTPARSASEGHKERLNHHSQLWIRKHGRPSLALRASVFRTKAVFPPPLRQTLTVKTVLLSWCSHLLVACAVAVQCCGAGFAEDVASDSSAAPANFSLDRLLTEHINPIEPIALISGEQLLCRASFDLLGRQPTPEELNSYLSNESPDRFDRAVERMLASPELGQNWANYWSDVISYRTSQPELTFLNYTPFKVWLARQFNGGVAWDKITTEIITAQGKVSANPAATFIGFHQANRNRLAGETSRIFLGVQIHCAECHDHPFIDMSQATFHSMAAFFVRSEAKLPWNDSGGIEVKSKAKGEHKMPETGEEVMPAAFENAKLVKGTDDKIRRETLARWIVSPDNPYFAKAHVNRVWSVLMGRGFCEPVDEIGEAAEPLLPEVHHALAQQFVASGYDMKALYRTILSSQFYRRSSASRLSPLFPGRPTRSLRSAEVFASLTSAIELPNVTPKIAKENDAFRFPIPPKSTAELVDQAFGSDPSLIKTLRPRTMQQAMFLMNNQQIQAQINASPDSGTFLARLLKTEPKDPQVIEQLYTHVLARRPRTDEIKLATKHIESLNNRSEAFEDLLWSLVNSAEFTTRR